MLSIPVNVGHLNISISNRASLAVLHGGTALTLCFYAYVMHTKVELSHPVFAVIFQEVIVLCACECVCFVMVLASGIDYDAYFFPMLLQGLAINFHQWSWLVVTTLR